MDEGLLQEALADTGRDHGPGLYGLVAEGGEVVFEGSTGVANVENPRPIEGQDQFRIGSLTKTYVAALVLQLAAEGVLSLTDSVERWLPDLVPQGEAITVETLLRMRSGVPDYTPQLLGDPPDWSVLQRYWSPQQLVDVALSAPDRLPPDTAFRYNNTDYVLLGMAIEEATGQRVDAQMWQRILDPLGLHDTTFPAVDPYLRGPHAPGYLRSAPTAPYVECTKLSPSEGWTSGAMVSTAYDLVRFLDGLFAGSVLDAASLARMTDCGEVIDEYRSRGLGVVRFDFGVGDVAFGHTGGAPGYSTIALRTAAGRCVVLWQNGIDVYDMLSTDAPFIRAALSA
jgi:D-alanyl-D-alanine carboxypeptidase